VSAPDLFVIAPTGCTSEQADAATRHILRRYEQGDLNATAARQVLEALGLVDGETAARYDSVGRRVNPRKQAAREARREGGI
jgi:hypothetical protein